ncbi:MAG: hypothetical protein NC041_06815 [Bacteroides sp.]|nr:hypothetical protein [Prevotella sp.]MCM1407008.1 hypothetical protein [Treponema brennaborense]MCM1470159.1 hypothetical protein [Bacteroides sp.]
MMKLPAKLVNSDEETKKIRAKVILCRCAKKSDNENFFGTRIEERGRIWQRTWSFKIDETKAKHESWDSQKITSSLDAAQGYNGCPYCGGFSLAQCGACGKLFCFGNEISLNRDQFEMKCPWCAKTGIYQTAETLEIQGGGM